MKSYHEIAIEYRVDESPAARPLAPFGRLLRRKGGDA
jgi:hypothetical protein